MRKRLTTSLGVGVLAVVACAWLRLGHAAADPANAQDIPASTQPAAKYLGVETCKACHGKNEAATNKRGTSDQMEFNTWSGPDKHSKAFGKLMEPKTEQMARHLGMKTLPNEWPNPEDPPEEWNRCLSCHSMNFIEKPRRGQRFKLSDGVSCDGCHGAAELWLGPHQEREYPESLKLGMEDIRNSLVRAEVCLSCHLGNRAEGKIVDHEMYAAGHPPLVFEIDAFSQKLPPHWREKKPAEDGSNLPRAQTWAAGQYVTLREAVRLLADDAKSDRWPEYSHFDCAACHHDLTEKSWRQNRPNPGQPGRPLWQGGHALIVGRPLLDVAGVPGAMKTLDRQLSSLAFGRAQEVAQSAEQVLRLVDEFTKQSASLAISADVAREVSKFLCGQAESLAWRGPAAARQLVFALQAMLSQALPPDASALKELHPLSRDLSEPASGFNPPRFIQRIDSVRGHIP